MIKLQNVQYKKLKLVMFCTLLCGFFAHAYCYFNVSFSHDSSLVTQSWDWNWQITIGRWIQPFYGFFRGDLYNPFLVGTLSLFFLAFSCYLILSLLNINSALGIFFTCGVLSTNCMVIYANATYIYLIDIYMLSLLFAVAGVYFYKKYKWGFAPSVILSALSLGLYQGFLQAGILLFMFLVLYDLLKNKDVVSVVKESAGYLFTLVLSVALYYAGYKAVLWKTGLSAADYYNSAAGLFEIGGIGDMISLIFGAYKYFFRYWLHPSTYNADIIAILTIILFVYMVYMFAYIVLKKKVRPVNLLLILLCGVLLPLGGNIIFVLAKGVEHELMIFSFFLFIVWAISLQEYKAQLSSSKPLFTVFGYPAEAIGIFCFCALFILNNIIFANQVYLKKDLEFKKTYATLNRVIDRIEQIDGYVVNQTPVAIVGSLSSSSLAERETFFSYDGAGLENSFSVTYYISHFAFLENVMGYPINLLDEASAALFKENETVQEMPTFPDPGSCQMIDGTVVVKLSDIN